MKLTFKADKPANLKAALARAKNDAAKRGIFCEGDAQRGRASGLGFSGVYVVGQDYITISVLKKPPFITNAMIERAVRKYLTHISGAA